MESTQYEYSEGEKSLAGHIILTNAYNHLVDLGEAGQLLLDLRSKCYFEADGHKICPMTLNWLLDLRRDGSFIGIKAVSHA